jgi:hypothetical protein
VNSQPPTGRIKAKRRRFEQVVADLRHIVFLVVRHRKAEGGKTAKSLGSGFFVSSKVFLTCYHVINSKGAPHQDGDEYHLVSNLTGTSGAIHVISDAQVGNNLHLFPECDLALLFPTAKKDQPFAALDYADVPIGKEIGVAGYPLPNLIVADGRLRYDGLIYRAAKGTVNAIYTTSIRTEEGGRLPNIPVIEVNFLFVPGNSGGPIFDSETGRILGFVHGYHAEKIRERVEQATLVEDIPDGVNKTYIENLNAIYSLGIKLDTVRPQLEKFGVSL